MQSGDQEKASNNMHINVYTETLFLEVSKLSIDDRAAIALAGVAI